MTLLAINWAGVALQAGYLFFSLSILVIVHEFGHYITARWFKCRVEKFYLFFDPWFSLFKKKVGNTEYGIGWLPLGGYVKIAGMVDESMDKEQLAKPPQPWEFRSKPAWQRLIIMLAGVTMNVLLAFFISAMILFTWGETKLPNAEAKDGIWVTDSLISKIGLQNGDKIVSINGETVKYFDDISLKILLGKTIEIDRKGVDTTIQIPVNIIEQLIEKKGKRNPLVAPRVPVIINELANAPESDSKLSGLVASSNQNYKNLQVGDQIVGVDSIATPYFDQLTQVLKTKKNDSVTLAVLRNQEMVAARVRVDSNGNIGFNIMDLDQLNDLGILKQETKKYGFFASFPAGVAKTGDQLSSYIQQLKLMVNPETGAYKGVGGFKTMASIFPSTGWDWEAFWKITAFFSIILAFMNLLPIPALDGGHVVFTLVEMITGRKPSDKFLEYAQIVGMVILFALLLYANGNDWFGWGSR